MRLAFLPNYHRFLLIKNKMIVQSLQKFSKNVGNDEKALFCKSKFEPIYLIFKFGYKSLCNHFFIIFMSKNFFVFSWRPFLSHADFCTSIPPFLTTNLGNFCVRRSLAGIRWCHQKHMEVAENSSSPFQFSLYLPFNSVSHIKM